MKEIVALSIIDEDLEKQSVTTMKSIVDAHDVADVGQTVMAAFHLGVAMGHQDTKKSKKRRLRFW